MATRTILQPNRAYDHIYDPVYTTSHANDHYRQTSKAMFNAQRIERVPDDKYLFSELPHYPRCTIQVTSKEALPRHVDKDWFSPVEKGADPNQDVVYGSHRFKFQAWPNKQMLSTLPHIVQYAFKSSHGSGFQAEGVAAAEPPTKTVGTQSVFRESEAQTDPYSPDYQIQPNQVPEVLQLTHLTYGAGLPATEAELQIIERTRQKRLFKQMLPPPCDEFGMEVRVQLMEAQEFREWADRERTIKDLQDKRLKLLEQALLERDVKREDAQVSKVERVRQRKEEERDRKLAACQRLRTKVLRKMQKERTRADAPTTKRDVIAEYADFTSEVYAPLARHGHVPDYNTAKIEVQPSDLSTFPGLVQLEASLHPSVLRAPEKHPKDMDKKKKSSHQVRKEKLQDRTTVERKVWQWAMVGQGCSTESCLAVLVIPHRVMGTPGEAALIVPKEGQLLWLDNLDLANKKLHSMPSKQPHRMSSSYLSLVNKEYHRVCNDSQACLLLWCQLSKTYNNHLPKNLQETYHVVRSLSYVKGITWSSKPQKLWTEEDGSSSSLNQDMILEEVRRQVQVAMRGRDQEVAALRHKNEQLELALKEKLQQCVEYILLATFQEQVEGIFTTGMRQLQQVYLGRADAKDSEMKVGSAELPEMPPVGPESAVAFSDWLYEVEQAVGGLSDKASDWFGMCLRLAQDTYEIYQQSDPLARLSLEPKRSSDLADAKWSRLERRVLTMLLGTLQKAAKDDAVTHRISSVPALLFRLHVLYAPGSSSERAAILRQLEGSSAGLGLAETVTALRKWRRHLQRAEEMKVSVPDASLLLRSIETIAGRAIDANQDVKFRLALSRNQLQLQYRPNYHSVLSYYNHVLAELQQETTKLKAANATGAGTGETTSPTRRGGGQLATTGNKVPCRFFAGDNGCTKGSSCKFDHTFASKEAKKAKCWHCGSVSHTQKDCPVKAGKASPQRPSSSTTTIPTTSPQGSMPTTLNQAAVQHQQAVLESLQASSSSGSQTAASTLGATGTTAAIGSVPQQPVPNSTEGDERKAQEITALLQEANAMLNKLTKLQAIQVVTDTSVQALSAQMRSLGIDDDERMALLDSGASHPFRDRAEHDVMPECPVRVDLAGGQSVTLQQNQAGTLMPTTTAKDPQDVSTILPLGALVQTLGCELSWTRRGGLKIVHPQHGTLRTVVRGNCPLIGETQALDLIHQLEQRKLQELRQATAETFLNTLALEEVKAWDELFATFVQTGSRAHLARSLESSGCPLQGLDGALRSLLSVDVDLGDEAGKKYMKALPVRRSQRRALLTKRWVVRLYEREGESSEDFKLLETKDTMVFNVNVHRSRAFSMKGNSAAYKVLVWGACRGQVEGVVGAPPSNDSQELGTKQLLLWMLAKEGARQHRVLSPYLAMTASPNSGWWKSTMWQGFQREYQVPVQQVSPHGESKCYCVATTLALSGEDAGWGPGVQPASVDCHRWSRSFVTMIVQGAHLWRRRPEPLMLCSGLANTGEMSAEELRRWKRHVQNGHLPYNRHCKTCVETAATGRSHRRLVAPSCYNLSIDLAGPFRVKGETADQKGFRYALVGCYVMPKIVGFKDYQIPEECGEEGDGPGGVGDIPLDPDDDFLKEIYEREREVSREEEEGMNRANEEYKKLFADLKDTVEYQNLHFMIPLKTRTAPEVEAAIRLLYVQLRSEGLPLQRVHSDRARELRGEGIRKWLLERDVYPTTGEAQVPQTNGKAEQVVKQLKRRARTLLQCSGLPTSCWPLAMGHAAWAQRECALERASSVIPFGAHVNIKAKVFGQGGKFDLNNKWDSGCFVGPSTELRGGFVVRDKNGRYLTTMHMKTNVVDVDEVVKPDEAEAVLPMPSRRVRKKTVLYEVPEDEVHPPTRDSAPEGSMLGPTGKFEVPVGEVHPPTRDSPEGTMLGPLGEAVVPEPLDASGLGVREDLEPPHRRVTGKTRLAAMLPLSDLEREIEDLALSFDLDERYDEAAVLQIFEMLEGTRPQTSKAGIRKSKTPSTSWSTGMFTHGGVSGLRTTARRMPTTTSFLVKAAKEITGNDCFGVVAITRGASMKVHRDSHNCPSTQNTLAALTEFQGGGVWIQEEGGGESREVSPGRWVDGKVHELHPGEPLFFNPRAWHETQDYSGDRIVIMTYTPRLSKLTPEGRRDLEDLGFRVPDWNFSRPAPRLQPLIMKQEYIIDRDGSLESFPVSQEGEMEHMEIDGVMLRLNEIQQTMMDNMLDRSSFLQDLLEEEEERLKDIHDAQHECLQDVKQVHGEIMQMLDAMVAKIQRERRVQDEVFLKAANVQTDHQDYEKLLEDLEGDLQVTHTVPLQQVKPVAEKWKSAIEKELSNLFESTGTLKRIKLSEARQLEAQGRLKLVPSKGVYTLKPPSSKGGGFRRKYRLVLCGNHVTPSDDQGSLYAGGVGAESLRALLAATSPRGWRGATTDITAAFLQAIWPESMPMYAVLPPKLLQELHYAEDGEAWLVLRPLYGLRESPSIWSSHRNDRLRTLDVPHNGGRLYLQQSKADAELWFVMFQSKDEAPRLVGLVVTYVDDIFYIGPVKIVEKIHGWVSAEWPCSGLEWASAPEGIRYLGMEVYQRESGEYEVTQQGYIMDLIRAHDLLQAPQTLLPCPKEWITDDVDPEPENFTEGDLRFAQRLIGEQLWLAMRCRPDIHFIVSYMSSWVSKHPIRISRIAMRVLSYLHKTAGMKMILGQPARFPEDDIDDSRQSSSSQGKQTSTTTNSQQRNNKVGGGFDNLKIVDNASAVAMLNGGSGSWRTRHLKVRSAFLLERIQKKWLLVEHIEGMLQKADLSTKVHSKLRLWALLKLWKFEGLPSEAETMVLMRMLAAACVAKAFEMIPKAEAALEDNEVSMVSRAGVDELLLFTLLACLVAVMVWEGLKMLSRRVWTCCCKPGRGKKAQRLKNLAKAAAEAEVDRAFTPERRQEASSSSSTSLPRFAPSRTTTTQLTRTTSTQTPDWEITRGPVPTVATPPREAHNAAHEDTLYAAFDGPFYRSEHGDTIHTRGDCYGFRLATSRIIQQRLCAWCNRTDPVFRRRNDARRTLRFQNTG
ncbi:Cfap91 [Symbiodinium sp. CCMP2592]|nr:Cfap91 [Symbiodinium sp. CCMP2592]